MWNRLERLAVMPAWLKDLDDDALVTAALVDAVPGASGGRLRGVRLMTRAWMGECILEIAGESRPVSATADILPPTSGIRLPVPRAGDGPGSPGWRCPVQRLNLHLGPAPDRDDDLPALALLTDPERARALLEAAIRTAAPAYRDLRLLAVVPRVMRHSRGSRCTVLFELELSREQRAPGWPEVVVAKTYHRPDKGQTAWDGMRALWDSPMAHSELVAVAEPLAWLPEQRILVQGPIGQDETLKELLLRSMGTRSVGSTDDVKSYVARTAAGLAQLHGCGVTVGPTVTWEDELADVRGVLTRLESVLPELRGAADGYLARLARSATQVPPDPAGPAHRSFRPAQVLIHGGRIGFIDFDGFCQGEPAIDVALFRATVRDLSMSVLPPGVPLAERLSAVDELCDHFLDSYTEFAPISRERVALWEGLDLLTNVLHSWTKVKPARLAHGFALLRHLADPPDARPPVGERPPGDPADRDFSSSH